MDNNIDEVLGNIDIQVLKHGKDVIVRLLKKIGNKLLSDVPDTSGIIKKIPKYKYNFNRVVLSDNMRSILIMVDIILFIVLLILNKSYKILKNITKIIILLISLLIVTNIYLLIIRYGYSDEWYFVRQAFDHYNYLLIKYEVICFLLITINILGYKFINKKRL